MMATRRVWAAGCALVMIAAVAFGWLLGAAPLLQTAKAADEAREAAEAQNSSYNLELETLKVEFEGIGELENQLADLHDEIPAQADLPGYLGQLTSAAGRHSVTLTAITVADAAAYAPTVAEVPAAETPVAETEATDADAAAAVAEVPVVEGAGVPVISPLVTAENLITIPVSLTVGGGYGNVLDFVESLQKGTRLTAVTAFSTAIDDAETGSEDPEGEPARTDTVTGTISLLIYVLLDPAE